MIAAIVPAAGMSTRMGENKLLLTFRGKPLIVHAVDTLLESEVDEIIVVVGHEAEKVKEKLEGKQVTLVENPNYREGMSTSVRAGLAAVPTGAGAIMIYLADQPLLEPEDVNRLIRAFAEAREYNKSIVVPFFRGQRGNPVILDSSHKEAILEVVGDVGCKRVIKRNPDKVHVVEMDDDHVIRDVDSIEDYKGLMSGSPLTPARSPQGRGWPGGPGEG
jgi:molybdenum cofactor cytidylyltransferase